MQPNPFALIGFAAIIPILLLTRDAWKQRHYQHNRVLFLLGLASLETLACYSVELLMRDLTIIRLLDTLNDFGISFIPTLLLMFALIYSGYKEWLTRRNTIILLGIQVIFFVIRATNDYHHQMWTDIHLEMAGPLVYLASNYNFTPIFLIYTIIAGTSFIAACVLILNSSAQTSTVYHVQRRRMAWLWVINLGAFLLGISSLTGVQFFDFQILGLTLGWIPLGWSLLRHQLLAISPREYNDLLRSSQDAAFVINSNNRVIEVNQAALQLLKKTPSQILDLPSDQVFSAMPELSSAFFSKSTIENTLTIHTDKSPESFQLWTAALRNERKQFMGLIISLHNVTALKRAEQQAMDLRIEREKVSLLEQFIRDTTHDLMTPISIMKTSGYILNRHSEHLHDEVQKLRALLPSDNPEVQAVLTNIEAIEQQRQTNVLRLQRTVERFQALISGLLDMLRLDRQTEFEFAPCRLNILIQEVLMEQELLAKAKNIQLLFHPSESIPILLLDSAAIARVVQNLVGNSLQYTHSGGAIHISTDLDALYAIMVFKDTGIGIPAEDLPSIFDRFYRVDKSRGSHSGGIGLGLAIVKKIVTAHRGKIEVTSTVGEGSEFKVYLPLPLAKP